MERRTPAWVDNVQGRAARPESHPPWTVVPDHGGALRCNACHSVLEPSDVRVLKMERWDVQSDPEDQYVVATLRCPSCAAEGDIELPFGNAEAGAETRVLSLLDWRPDEAREL